MKDEYTKEKALKDKINAIKIFEEGLEIFLNGYLSQSFLSLKIDQLNLMDKKLILYKYYDLL